MDCAAMGKLSDIGTHEKRRFSACCSVECNWRSSLFEWRISERITRPCNTHGSSESIQNARARSRSVRHNVQVIYFFHIYSHRDTKTQRHKDTDADTDTDRQTDRQTHRQTDAQTDTQTDAQTRACARALSLPSAQPLLCN